MKDVTGLTKEQQDKIPSYISKWLQVGRKVGNYDREKAAEAVKLIYRLAQLTEPKDIIFTKSPFEAQTLVNIIKSSQIKTDLSSTKNNPVNISSAIWTKAAEVLEVSETDPEFLVLKEKVKTLKFEYAATFYASYYSYSWVGTYDFILSEVFPEEKINYKDFVSLVEALQQVYCFIPFEDVAFISDYPVALSLDSEGRLHNEHGPSMEFSDGYVTYDLNGISVPEFIITTPKDQIDPKLVLAMTNVEQRARVMRFLGLDKFLESLHAKEIDTNAGYTLYSIEVEGRRIGPYLYMTCPSTGRKFLEGVGDPVKNELFDSSIKTCKDALKWRAQKASKDFMTKFNLKWDYKA